MRGESGISFTGLCYCGAISFVMLVLKLRVIDNLTLRDRHEAQIAAERAADAAYR